MNKLKRLAYESSVLLKSMPAITFGLYLLALVLMNVLANKSLELGVDYLALDCGIMLSWIVFLVMDLTTKYFGLKAANILTVAGLLLNLLFSGVLIICGLIPGVWAQSFVEGSESVINLALDNTLMSSWFVIFGSSVSFLISAILNNVLNNFIGKRLKSDGFVAFAFRSLVSTFIGQFVDNLCFAFIVSYNFFGWSVTECITCAIFGAVFELLFEVVFSPIGYKILRLWEKQGVGKAYLDLVKEDKI